MTSSQTTGSLPSLPQELIDRIIDCHQDDGQNLRSFALVSYSWMIRARRHLFTSVTVSKNFPLRGEKSHFASFVRVLQAGPSVSHAVQRLSINHTTTTLQEIFPILHQLVQLRALSLFTVSIPPSSTIADMTPVFDSLELLVLSSCSVERVEDVVWLICLLSRSLKALHILSLFHTASSGRDVDPSPIPGELSGHNRHIDALVFKPNLDRGHDELCSQLVTGLLNLLDDRSLTSLDINLDPHPFSWVKGTSRLLTVAAPRLQNLNVVILNSSAKRHYAPMQITKGVIDLSACTLLESAQFYFALTGEDDIWADPLNILNAVPTSAPLSRIKLHYSFNTRRPMEDYFLRVFAHPDFAAVARALHGGQTPESRHLSINLKFLYSNRIVAHKDREIIADALSRFGITSFDLNGPQANQ